MLLRLRLRLVYLCLCAWPPFSVVICWGRARRARRWGQAGCSLVCCVCSTPAWSSCVSCGPPLLLLGGHAPPSKDPLVVKLSPLCWLATLRAWEGLRSRGLLAASGSGKFGCSLCFADASERGVNPRLEVGGSACFPLALRSPGCGCFR